MLHFKDKTKDFRMSIMDLCFGETFKYDDEYFVVMEDEGDNAGIPCYDLLNNRVIEFDGEELVTTIEIDCIVKEE